MSNQCLDVVKKNKQKILDYVLKYLKFKGVTHQEIFVWKSRVAGTCRPNSDIDIYVQLDKKHVDLIKEQGSLWGDRKIFHKCGEDLKRLGLRVIDVVKEGPCKGDLITLDIGMGVLPYPPNPLKPAFEGKKWWMKLSEV
ncbi:hypothetical protein ES703_42938 [subsurface metagenome]